VLGAREGTVPTTGIRELDAWLLSLPHAPGSIVVGGPMIWRTRFALHCAMHSLLRARTPALYVAAAPPRRAVLASMLGWLTAVPLVASLNAGMPGDWSIDDVIPERLGDVLRVQLRHLRRAPLVIDAADPLGLALLERPWRKGGWWTREPRRRPLALILPELYTVDLLSRLDEYAHWLSVESGCTTIVPAVGYLRRGFCADVMLHVWPSQNDDVLVYAAAPGIAVRSLTVRATRNGGWRFKTLGT